MSVESARDGRTATTENVINFIKCVNEPCVSAPDVADEFDISQQAAYEKLRRLNEDGVIRRKKVGARAVVWFLDRDYSLAPNDSDT